eukprot:1161322-Pelagomonas_calceolata.AAC.5
MPRSPAIAQLSARILSASEGLDRRNSFAQCVYSGQPINVKDFVVDLRNRHRSAWPTEDQAEHDGHPNKLGKYHNWAWALLFSNFPGGQQLGTAQQQHADPCKKISGEAVPSPCFDTSELSSRLSVDIYTGLVWLQESFVSAKLPS